MTDYEQQQPDRAVKNLKDVLSALKYHQIPAVNTILVNQANRVGTMFNQMENVLATRPGYQRPNPNIQTQWKSWIKGRADRARTKADTYLTENLKHLKDGYATDYQRDPQFSDGVLLAKIDALEAAINGRTTWANPF